MGALYAASIEQELGLASALEASPSLLAAEAFVCATCENEIQHAADRLPVMASSDFMAAVSKFITQQESPDLRDELEQQLAWLRRAVEEQKREE